MPCMFHLQMCGFLGAQPILLCRNRYNPSRKPIYTKEQCVIPFPLPLRWGWAKHIHANAHHRPRNKCGHFNLSLGLPCWWFACLANIALFLDLLCEVEKSTLLRKLIPVFHLGQQPFYTHVSIEQMMSTYDLEAYFRWNAQPLVSV